MFHDQRAMLPLEWPSLLAIWTGSRLQMAQNGAEAKSLPRKQSVQANTSTKGYYDLYYLAIDRKEYRVSCLVLTIMRPYFKNKSTTYFCKVSVMIIRCFSAVFRSFSCFFSCPLAQWEILTIIGS